MQRFQGLDAYQQLVSNLRARTARIPTKTDSDDYRDGGVFPPFTPKFQIQKGETIFTIGSCFARNIEAVLTSYGFAVPVADYTCLPGELPYAGPHLLNEYNAGTIMQRIEAACGVFHYDDTMGIEEVPGGFIDLFLHIHAAPTTKERLIARRGEIDDLYRKLVAADVVIITMGLVECWFDRLHGCYLNRAPSKKLVQREPGRFEFHYMDLDDVYRRMTRALQALESRGQKRVVLTVSPVPIEATFMPQGAVISNGYAKAVLRACAGMITSASPSVDYYPSYEIVTSFGSAAFKDDNVHVREAVVAQVTHYMVQNYAAWAEGAGDAPLYERFIGLLRSGDVASARDAVLSLLAQDPVAWKTHDALRLYFMAIGAHKAALDSALQAVALGGADHPVLERHVEQLRAVLGSTAPGMQVSDAA